MFVNICLILESKYVNNTAENENKNEVAIAQHEM